MSFLKTDLWFWKKIMVTHCLRLHLTTSVRMNGSCKIMLNLTIKISDYSEKYAINVHKCIRAWKYVRFFNLMTSYWRTLHIQCNTLLDKPFENFCRSSKLQNWSHMEKDLLKITAKKVQEIFIVRRLKFNFISKENSTINYISTEAIINNYESKYKVILWYDYILKTEFLIIMIKGFMFKNIFQFPGIISHL